MPVAPVMIALMGDALISEDKQPRVQYKKTAPEKGRPVYYEKLSTHNLQAVEYRGLR
jgi:hypothetical protein